MHRFAEQLEPDLLQLPCTYVGSLHSVQFLEYHISCFWNSPCPWNVVWAVMPGTGSLKSHLYFCIPLPIPLLLDFFRILFFPVGYVLKWIMARRWHYDHRPSLSKNHDNYSQNSESWHQICKYIQEIFAEMTQFWFSNRTHQKHKVISS